LEKWQQQIHKQPLFEEVPNRLAVTGKKMNEILQKLMLHNLVNGYIMSLTKVNRWGMLVQTVRPEIMPEKS
jgi:hypothetical protein